MADEKEFVLQDPDLEEKEIEEGKAAALLAYIPFLCFVPLIKMRDNRYAVAHGKQGLVLLFLEILAALLLVPRISALVWQLVLIGCLAGAVIGVFEVLQGRWYKIPVIGGLAERLKI
jgi:fumarate reductase subunit D